MKWIVNPDVIYEMNMNESKFSMIQFPIDYFEKTWGNVNSPQHRGKYYVIRSADVNHICGFSVGVKFFGNSYYGETPYIEYGLAMQSDHYKFGNSDKIVTLVTFAANPLEELYRYTINAYMLFVNEGAVDMKDTTNEIETCSDKENEECCDVDIPDTRIRGLIQVKTEYSFDLDKVELFQPYRIRFLQDIDIFDQHFKYNNEIYAILSGVTETSLRFATAGTVIHDNRIAVPFELTPDMKFELDKLV